MCYLVVLTVKPSVKGSFVSMFAFLKNYICREKGCLLYSCLYAISLYKQHLTESIQWQISHVSSQQIYSKTPDCLFGNYMVACFKINIKCRIIEKLQFGHKMHFVKV